MSKSEVIADLLGGKTEGFHGSRWPRELGHFRANREWFEQLASLSVFHDSEEWLDKAPELVSFGNLQALARSEARRRYQDGESIYIIGLDRTVKPLRELCDGLAVDLSLNPGHIMVQAWAAGCATSVGMHYDLDFNFNLQVVGRKHWTTAPNDLVANPISSHHTQLGDSHVTDQGRLLPSEMPVTAKAWLAEPGDVIYLPRGVWHATRTEGATFAMAFVIQPPTWADLVSRALRDRLHADARWRERVMGARQLAQHAPLKAVAGDALAASREILGELGPSEVLYSSLWGTRPAFFRRGAGIVGARFDAASATLAWQSGAGPQELPVPPWAQPAVEFIVNAGGSWSMGALQDLVSGNDVVFLNLFVKQLLGAGFIEDAPAAVGGVAPALKERPDV